MHDDIPLTTGRARRVLDERILPAVHGVSAVSYTHLTLPTILRV